MGYDDRLIWHTSCWKWPDLKAVPQSAIERSTLPSYHLNLTEFVTSACANGIHLERDIVNPASVDADDIAVRNILSILIDNAICYSSRDSVVTVKLSLIENQPRIDVMDSGAGIPIDALPFIYDRFYRGASQEIEGSGLGLAIAKAAADRNNIRLLHQRRTDVQGTVATMIFNQCSA